MGSTGDAGNTGQRAQRSALKGEGRQLVWLTGAGASNGSVPGASPVQAPGLGRKARAMSAVAEVAEAGARVTWVEAAGAGVTVSANKGAEASNAVTRAIADASFTRGLPETMP